MRRSILIVACFAALAADRQPDEATIMARILTRVRESATKIPNYACVETVTREYYAPIAPVERSCEVVLAAEEHPTLAMQLRHTSTDRLRIEVAMSSRGEMHSWPGELNFHDGKIDEVVREGPVGTGAFGAFLTAVFAQDVRNYRFIEQLAVDGHARARFSFHAPRADSHYLVKIGNEWKATAYSGTFEADAETGEVKWVELNTAILPEIAGTCQTRSRIDLGRTTIGDSEFLLASRARQEFIATDGSHAVNTIQFSSCREYRGESTITFDPPPAPAANERNKKTPASAPVAPVAGVRFELDLISPIDSATAAAGDRFTARLYNPSPTARRYLPNSARVEGRILRVQSYYGKAPEVIVVLRPETFEVKGVKVAFTAIQDTKFAIEQQRKVTKQKRGTLIILPYPSEKNAGLFRFAGEHTVVKRGFATHWITVQQ